MSCRRQKGSLPRVHSVKGSSLQCCPACSTAPCPAPEGLGHPALRSQDPTDQGPCPFPPLAFAPCPEATDTTWLLSKLYIPHSLGHAMA